jgi:hypothetical protein
MCTFEEQINNIDFQRNISLFFLNPLWGEVIVNFGDIGGIVDHYCLNILFITINEVYMIVINIYKQM